MRAIVMGVGLARQNAVSHRRFTVGAVGVGLRQTLRNGDYISKTFYGANDKPEPDGSINIHAEHEVLHAAEEKKAVLSVLALYGDNQPDDGKGLKFPAITPCSRICLPKLRNSSAIDLRRTLFSSLSPDRKTILLYKFVELERAYATDNATGIYRIDLHQPLALFNPPISYSECYMSTTVRNEMIGDEFFDGIDTFTQQHLQDMNLSNHRGNAGDKLVVED